MGQMKDQALGKKTRMSQWLASVYEVRPTSRREGKWSVRRWKGLC